MGKYIFKRIAAALFTIIIASTITFFIMNMVPGDPFMSEKASTPEVKAELEKKYGLDKPLYIQYKNYMVNLAQGDLGVSMKLSRNREITDMIKESFPISAALGIRAIIFAVLFGIPLGCIAALKKGKWQDEVIRFISTLGIAVPGFVVATGTMLIFAVNLKWVPVSFSLGKESTYILPAFTLGFYPMCYIIRLMRSSMLDAIGQDFIRTARAKGMSEMVVTFKHALRNSLIPVITYLGPLIAGILTGGFVVEKVFNVPGLGRYFVNAIMARDYMVIMGMTIFLATLIIVMNLICDLLYKVVDPRIQLGDERG